VSWDSEWEEEKAWFLAFGRKSEIPQKGPNKDRYKTESRSGNVAVADTFGGSIRKLMAIEPENRVLAPSKDLQ
jgi:hypothetical protein